MKVSALPDQPAICMVRFLPTLIIAFILLSLTANAQTQTDPATTCDSKWHTLATVDPGTSFGDFDSLVSVAAISPTDVWSVGIYYAFSSSTTVTLAEHWNGHKWSLVQTPNSKYPTTTLIGVAGTSSNDVWAVGYEQDTSSDGPYLTLIEHWNGKKWSIVQNGTHKGVLNSVVALAPNDVWAVGTVNYPGPGVIEHWDGHKWSYMRTTEANLRSVAAISSKDVWAVGQQYAKNGDEDTIALHFDGSKWNTVKTPNPLQRHPGTNENWLTSISPLSSTDLWVSALWRDTDNGILDHSFSLHGDGSKWTMEPTKNPGGTGQYNDLWALAALSDKNVWAVGQTGLNDFQPLIEHWDGTKWQVSSSPNLQGTLQAITRVPSTNNLFAAGNQVYMQPDVYNGTLIEYVCH